MKKRFTTVFACSNKGDFYPPLVIWEVKRLPKNRKRKVFIIQKIN